jgi:hypothetical protein
MVYDKRWADYYKRIGFNPIDTSEASVEAIKAVEVGIADKPSPLDEQVGETKHYKFFAIQPIVYCYRNKLNNIQSEVISYVTRYDKKWPDNKDKQIEDLDKAIHSIEILKEFIRNG